MEEQDTSVCLPYTAEAERLPLPSVVQVILRVDMMERGGTDVCPAPDFSAQLHGIVCNLNCLCVPADAFRIKVTMDAINSKCGYWVCS
jgi:hypothetical protein